MIVLLNTFCAKSIRYLLILVFCIPFSFAGYSQLPVDLKKINVDELSDAQILEYIRESEKSDIPVEAQDDLALKNGMPPSELQKLKDRVNRLRASNTTSATPNNIPNTATGQGKGAVPLEKAADKIVIEAPAPVADQGLTPDEIYGHHLFKNNNLEFFEKASDVKAPDNYIIGVNDELIVSVFGFSYFNEALKVDSRGAINPTGIGPIKVKGMTFVNAKSLIRSKFSQFFDLSNNQLTITLSYSRVINVNFVGEVIKPGSYKIVALNTAFNALIAVGGPNDLGSVRNIMVKRNGKVVKTLDVYEYLRNPNSKLDFYLEDNDYIYVAPAEKIVTISGQVRRQMRYELKENENLEDLIEYAGGTTSQAYTKLIRIKRSSEDGIQQQLINLSLDSLKANKKKFTLQDGDQVEIGARSTELRAFVEIQGAVNMPGQFEFVEGQRISDLIRLANGTRFESLLEKAYLIRLKENLTKEYISVNIKEIISNPKSDADLLLRKGDIIRIASNKDFTDNLKVDAVGAFRNPGSLDYSNGMTLGDLLFSAGGLKMEADILHIEISRISFFTDEYKPGEDSRIIIKILEVGRDIRIADDQLSFKLRPFDQVFARIVPDFEYQQNFSITGEVRYPGVYSLEYKDEKLATIIKRSGGLNRFAFPEGATLYRPNLPGGYVVMNLKDALRKADSRYNYIIKAGDVINVPKIIDLIAIKGDVEFLAVVNQEEVNTPFVKGRRANYYVKEFANGFTKTSLRKKTYVLDHNGKVNRTKNFVIFKVYPKVKKGAVIYVVSKPVNEKKEKKKSEPIDWNKTIADVTIKITGLLTLIILVRTVTN